MPQPPMNPYGQPSMYGAHDAMSMIPDEMFRGKDYNFNIKNGLLEFGELSDFHFCNP